MSCSPDILLFVEKCEAQEVEERRAKFIVEEEEVYRRRASSPTSQDTRLIDEAREEVGDQRNEELLRRILDEETRDAANTGEIPEGIVKWKGEYRGRASGDIYSETEVRDAQKNGCVLWTMIVDQVEHGQYKDDVWFNQEIHDSVGLRDENGDSYLCGPGWPEPEEYFEYWTEEPYPDEVKKKAFEIIDQAKWLPNFSHPTGRGKYFLEGKSGESGFISWKEGETLCYVSALNGNVLQTNGKPGQYKGFKGREKKRYRHLLGTALLDYFAPWR